MKFLTGLFFYEFDNIKITKKGNLKYEQKGIYEAYLYK